MFFVINYNALYGTHHAECTVFRSGLRVKNTSKGHQLSDFTHLCRWLMCQNTNSFYCCMKVCLQACCETFVFLWGACNLSNVPVTHCDIFWFSSQRNFYHSMFAISLNPYPPSGCQLCLWRHFPHRFTRKRICLALVNKFLTGYFWAGITKQPNSEPNPEKPSPDKMVYQIVTGTCDVHSWFVDYRNITNFEFQELSGMTPGTLNKLKNSHCCWSNA